MISPQVILETLIKRLQVHVPDGPRLRRGWWGDNRSSEQVRIGLSGRGRLEYALRFAQDAIASADADRIALAAQVCPMWERDGLRQKQQHEEANRRKSGGRERGRQQRDVALLEWEPWIKRFLELTASGRKAARARTIVKKEMTAASFILSATGEFPSARSIQDRLK
jgi:hypothetical protein